MKRKFKYQKYCFFKKNSETPYTKVTKVYFIQFQNSNFIETFQFSQIIEFLELLHFYKKYTQFSLKVFQFLSSKSIFFKGKSHCYKITREMFDDRDPFLFQTYFFEINIKSLFNNQYQVYQKINEGFYLTITFNYNIEGK